MAFLPGLCRTLLGEELRLPSVATWWCGQEAAREATLRGLERRVVKRSFVGHAEPAFAGMLTPEAREKLAARVRANPENFVGQERVALSTAPLWTGEHLEPRQRRHVIDGLGCYAHRGNIAHALTLGVMSVVAGAQRTTFRASTGRLPVAALFALSAGDMGA